MKTRCLTLLIVAALGVSANADAQPLVAQPGNPIHPLVTQPANPTGQLVVNPANPANVGPIYSYPNGIYSPYPGIWAPVPYPNWYYPPHWIYSYMANDPVYRNRHRNNGDEEGYDGKSYRGRDTLAPAVPYTDYLKDQKDLLKQREIASKPAPTAEKALLEIRMPKANAKLYFDDKEVAGDGEVRNFLTPALKAGQTYQFTIKSMVPAFPDDIVTEQSVSFRAGDHRVVDLRSKR